MSESIANNIFNHPFTCLVAGPTQSGKTTFIEKIIQHNKTAIHPNINRIIYCYARWQDKYDYFKLLYPRIEFNMGLYDIDLINPKDNNLIILDDLTHLCEKDDSVLNLFTTDSHQKNISVVLLTQNVFSKGKHFRTISLNSHYVVLMNNPRDRLQVQSLARQMFPKKSQFLIEAYQDATLNKFGYLFLDLTQSTDDSNRVQTGVLPNQERIIYRPKN